MTGKGTCSAGDNYCDDNANTCNGNDLCGCLPTKEKGNTRCVSLLAIGGCCGSDAHCVAAHPSVPGAVCIAATGCGGCEGNAETFNGACYGPCEST